MNLDITMIPDNIDALNVFKYIVEHFIGNRRNHDVEVMVENV